VQSHYLDAVLGCDRLSSSGEVFDEQKMVALAIIAGTLLGGLALVKG
jgi:hypothetical protein